MLKRIEKLLPANENKFAELVEKLESKVVLHKDLQEKLDDIGETPLEESELNDAINAGKKETVKHLLTDKEIGLYSAMEVGDFLYQVEQKITSLQREDGTFKSTPNTENCDMPNFLEAEEMMSLAGKETELRNQLKKASGKDAEKILKKFKKVSDELKAKAFEISGLDEEKLSEWEKILVITQIYVTSTNAALSSMGKHSLI